MNVVNLLPQKVKNTLVPIYRALSSNYMIRKLRTSNFSSGKIALGEKNNYGFPGDWITVDFSGADFNTDFGIMKKFPFDDNSQIMIYSSHTAEHLEQEALEHVIKECYRILKKGGAIRIEAPDTQKMIDAYKANDRAYIDYFVNDSKNYLIKTHGLDKSYAEEQNSLIGVISCYIDEESGFNGHIPVKTTKAEFDEKIYSLDTENFGQWCVSLQTPKQRQSHGHINPIYFEKLEKVLRKNSFINIKSMKNRETNIQGLDIEKVERNHRDFFSLYVEAYK